MARLSSTQVFGNLLVTGNTKISGELLVEGDVIGIDKTDVGLSNVDNTSDLDKPISTATQTALDGKANATHNHTIDDVSGLQSALDGKLATTGTAAAATKLATARTIGGVSFNGTANINLPGVNTTGNQNTTGSAAKLTTARTLTIGSSGKPFDGSANVTWTLVELGAAPTSHTHADATTTTSGFMASADKVKLNGIEAGAQVNLISVDNLTSDSATRPLSAKQGKILKSLIDSINTLLQSDDSTLDELQEIVDFIKLNREELDSLGISSIAGLEDALAGKQPLSSILTGTTASFTTSLKSKLDAIAAQATKNATDAQLRDRTTHTGVQSISTIDGLQTSLDAKANTSTQVIAGTGLTGGGTLAADRTLSVAYGTTAGTAAQGNDSRLSNSREWTASVVTQAEAEAGTATTARKWTAQRVAQAISALGLKIGTTATTAKVGNWTPTWSEVSSKPTTFTPSEHTHSLSQITDAGNLAALSTNNSTTNFLRGDGTWVTPPNTNTTYSEITTSEIDAGTASTLRTISGRRMKYALDKKSDTGHAHAISDVTGLQEALDGKLATTGTAAAATKLATARTIGGVSFNGTANINLPGVNTTGNQNTTGSAATLTTSRTINGTSFNGSANITTANWGTSRNLTIGNSTKSVNGSAAVTWSLSEIGAVDKSYVDTIRIQTTNANANLEANSGSLVSGVSTLTMSDKPVGFRLDIVGPCVVNIPVGHTLKSVDSKNTVVDGGGATLIKLTSTQWWLAGNLE